MAVKLSKRNSFLIILGLLVAMAVGTFLLIKNNDSGSNGSQASQPAGSSHKASSSVFAPVSTTKLAFSATLSTTNNGKTTTVTLKSDGKGNSFYSIGKGANRVEITYTKDAYYQCSGTNPCLKYPISQSANSGFDPNNYQYDSNAIRGLQSTAIYKNQQSCPAGTCYVWSTTQGSTLVKVFIDTKTSRISQIEGTTGKQSTKSVYDYKAPVTITPPANAKSPPTQKNL